MFPHGLDSIASHFGNRTPQPQSLQGGGDQWRRIGDLSGGSADETGDGGEGSRWIVCWHG
ncbi:hypothetical protein ASPCADRAFT_204102 [Aspergillus carbonarius ITEM 5010]|uniref:Uncharacterized protein n=1 Tax=Aspergillus carbonarius (strain ITEM 5010) TaxID=602072 RepID=A0A1R3S0F5_ASPC5|nr:hypothetical protein ASPCADRAFT_204102 [Aspergillus carbonarius ITEM 5010]